MLGRGPSWRTPWEGQCSGGRECLLAWELRREQRGWALWGWQGPCSGWGSWGGGILQPQAVEGVGGEVGSGMLPGGLLAAAVQGYSA